MDERDPDKLHSPPDSNDDDAEYELEPLDPAVVRAEQRHASKVAEDVRASIDIDEVYRDAERNRGTEILENWARNFKYRFHIKHLIVATALLAIAVAVAELGYLAPALMILVLGSAAGLYLYLNWEERKQQAEAYEKRQELYAKRRERLQAKGATDSAEPPQSIESATPATTTSEPVADISNETPPPEPFRIQFSLRALMIAMTVAAVSLGIIHYVGGPDPTATILGLIAVAGLVVYAIGFEPSQSVVLGWWFILLLYVVLTIAGAI